MKIFVVIGVYKIDSYDTAAECVGAFKTENEAESLVNILLNKKDNTNYFYEEVDLKGE